MLPPVVVKAFIHLCRLSDEFPQITFHLFIHYNLIYIWLPGAGSWMDPSWSWAKLSHHYCAYRASVPLFGWLHVKCFITRKVIKTHEWRVSDGTFNGEQWCRSVFLDDRPSILWNRGHADAHQGHHTGKNIFSGKQRNFAYLLNE